MGEAQRPNETPGRKGKSRAKQKGAKTVTPVIWVLIVIGLLAAAAAGGYIWNARQYQTVFFPQTVINGVNASGKTIDEVKALINKEIDGYVLELAGRDGETASIAGEAINLHSVFDGSLESMLTRQNPYEWGSYYFEPSVYQVETMVGYDEELLKQAIADLRIFDPSFVRAPEDARLSDYISEVGYEIIPEKEGTLLDEELVKTQIYQAILNLQPKLSLEELGAYIPPAVRSDDTLLNERLAARNRYVQMSITHNFGANREVLTGDQIHSWLTFNEEGGITLDEAAITEYVADLARRYNTAYQPKTLKTSYGPEVTIAGGNYGWRINQSAECAAIAEIIRSGESQVREPIYSQTAASRGEHDYGNTYVEINLTAQHLYFYKEGNLVVESDFVSGNVSKGWATPAGAFPITYKQRNATLKGEGYATPVDYWMPFNGGIGMHDAGWRSGFGGAIYKTNGSHGCVNLPPAVAKTIYEEISAGMPVLCYHLSNTESGGSSIVPEETTAAAETTAPAETSPAETVPEETGVAPEETGTVPPEETADNTELPSISPLDPTTAPETTAAESESATSDQTQPEPAESTKAPVGPGGAENETPAITGPGM